MPGHDGPQRKAPRLLQRFCFRRPDDEGGCPDGLKYHESALDDRPRQLHPSAFDRHAGRSRAAWLGPSFTCRNDTERGALGLVITRTGPTDLTLGTLFERTN